MGTIHTIYRRLSSQDISIAIAALAALNSKSACGDIIRAKRSHTGSAITVALQLDTVDRLHLISPCLKPS